VSVKSVKITYLDELYDPTALYALITRPSDGQLYPFTDFTMHVFDLLILLKTIAFF
jgi:hypothetical protein